jgi:ATP-dependent DNA helicase RecQ
MLAVDTRQQALSFLRQSLGDPTATFREGQWEAIEALVERRARLLVVQRTGWGKSLVYFMTTHLLRERGAGPTLVISPLLSLMRNQLMAARQFGLKAETINGDNRQEWGPVIHGLRAGKVDLLLIAPERLANTTFREQVLQPLAARIGLFVVDEAHCISDWGHDFRPDYRRIARVLAALHPATPVLATTATANNRVIDDVVAQLGPDVELMRGPLIRESLRLQNIHLPTPSARLAWLAEHLPLLPGSGIIYTQTVADALQLARWLRRCHVDAHAYYGALDTEQREALERRLLHNEVKALVATTALSMGFDKPDLHWVIHFQRPGSVVHYYQQVGRAGRALDEAYGILLGGDEDQEITDYFIRTAFPADAHVERVLQALRRAEDGLTPELLQRELNLMTGEIDKALKHLDVSLPSPVRRWGGRWYATTEPYTPDRAKIEWLTSIRYKEQGRMVTYAGNHTCLMRFLTSELNDPQPDSCGKCAVCSGEFFPATYTPALAEQAVEFLRRNEQRIEPRRQWPEDALVAHGWRGAIPSELQAERGRALCRWGDDGWGTLVREGKQRGRGDTGLFAMLKWLITGRHPTAFDERLVAAIVTLVRERWRPSPAPAWITCVPSRKHPALVPNFARRVAQELRLPFVPCVRKLRDTQPQKTMQNDYQQAHNLEHAFAVEAAAVRSGPVLLLDDMVDSGWTFTVITALLRGAGSGPVFPLALGVATRTGDG